VIVVESAFCAARLSKVLAEVDPLADRFSIRFEPPR
jgi:hypothetical protein